MGRYKIKSDDDYLVAGRKHGVWWITGTLSATVVGAGSTIGAAGVAYFVGISAAWYLLSAVIALLLLSFTFAPALRKLSLYTVPEYIGKRYGSRARWVASVLGVVGLIMFLAAQLYAMGEIIVNLMGMPLNFAILLAASVAIFYTWRGGNVAIHISDNIQIIWIVMGFLFVFFFGLSELREKAYASFDPPSLIYDGKIMNHWFNPFTRKAVSGFDLLALGSTVVGWIIMSITWHFTMQSTAQRILSSRSPAVARMACLLAALFLIPLALIIAACGMIARFLVPDLPGVEGVAQTQALPALIQVLLPSFFGGIVIAALIAVMMSTVDSALLGASTIFVNDIAQRLNHHSVPVLTLVFGLLSLGLAIWAKSLIKMLEVVAGVYCIATFVPILLGLYWKRATENGALAAMGGSALSTLFWRFSGLETSTGIHMLTVGLPLAFLAILGISLLDVRDEKNDS
ncbi:MAG: sodium:solute symporter family protein [Calditrichaeota bacterium]|nr:sodium:solute symporter family protein [Calditrichota bacterium]